MIDRVAINLIARALGLSPSQARRRARNDAWVFATEKLPTGNVRRVYPVARLPVAVREAILPLLSQQAAVAITAPAEAPAGGSPPIHAPAGVAIVGETAHLTDAQRATMDARAIILDWVSHLGHALGGITAARQSAERMAKTGALPENINRLVPIANARAGSTRTLSATTLKRWALDRAGQGGQAAALAPKTPQPDMSVPPWAAALLTLYRTPQKRSLREIVTQDLTQPGALPPGISPPSYDQAKRFIGKISTIERNRGRMGVKELKSLLPYVQRDLTGLDPLDIVQSDGHCLDAETLHPRHGRPFRPEMTSIIDLATRLCVGWSAGLAENALGVTEAIVYMATRWGIPAVWYVDNGSGYNNQLMDDQRTGLLVRLGSTKLNRLPHNPQAGGYVERSHQTIWIAGAKKLPSYMGKDMDRQAKQTVFKLTRADLKATGGTHHLMRWDDFIAWAEEQVRLYNNRPHRGLAKISDPTTGRRRHMTPMEAWNAALARGWTPMTITATEAADLTRPYETRMVQRASVSVLGNTYYAKELKDHHGDEVLVGYDIHDANRVWVRDLHGRLICEARFEANKRAVVPRSYLDQALDRRHEGRIRRAQEHIKEIHEERGHVLIDVTAAPILPENVTAIRDHLVLELTATPIPTTAPATAAAIPETPDGRWQKWRDIDEAITTGGQVNDDLRRWHQRYQLSAEWRARSDLFGTGTAAATIA